MVSVSLKGTAFSYSNSRSYSDLFLPYAVFAAVYVAAASWSLFWLVHRRNEASRSEMKKFDDPKGLQWSNTDSNSIRLERLQFPLLMVFCIMLMTTRTSWRGMKRVTKITQQDMTLWNQKCKLKEAFEKLMSHWKKMIKMKKKKMWYQISLLSKFNQRKMQMKKS